MPPLLIFTTSQTPLPTRLPRPRKPQLILPLLIHRSLHLALDTSPPNLSTTNRTILIPHPDTLIKHDTPSTSKTTHQNGDTPSDPLIDSQPPTQTHTSEHDPTDGEITVKLHLISPSDPGTRIDQIHSALSIVSKYKGLNEIDHLLVGFSGVDYKGKKTAATEMFGCGTEGLESPTGSDTVSPTVLEGIITVWRELSKLKGTMVKDVGTLYLPMGILERLCEELIRPKINAMDTPDCHTLPKEYLAFAKEAGVELWAGGGGEGSDPIPDADLHNLLTEFTAHFDNFPTLERSIPLREDKLKYEEAEVVPRGVEVQWVLSYTLVSRTRGLVRDKGYIISADIL